MKSSRCYVVSGEVADVASVINRLMRFYQNVDTEISTVPTCDTKSNAGSWPHGEVIVLFVEVEINVDFGVCADTSWRLFKIWEAFKEVAIDFSRGVAYFERDHYSERLYHCE